LGVEGCARATLRKRIEKFGIQRELNVKWGASQFLNKGRRMLVSTGLQPGDEGRRPLGSRFNGFRTHRKPVETGLIRWKTGFTRLKPGANERRSKTEMRPAK
jgi:hypothetical protein